MNEQENNVSFFRFEDLRIYAKVMDYIAWIHQEMKKHSEDNDAACVNFMKDSFLKAAHAIALQTAEGSSRNRSQFLYYLKMAKSSVRECVVYTETAFRWGFFSGEAREYSRNQLMELTKMIGSLISSLQRSEGLRSRADKSDDSIENIPDFDNL